MLTWARLSLFLAALIVIGTVSLAAVGSSQSAPIPIHVTAAHLETVDRSFLGVNFGTDIDLVLTVVTPDGAVHTIAVRNVEVR